MGNLLELKECGQSFWLDNLTRKKIRSGELERRIKEEGLGGITSNPAIFEKAIGGSDDYDDQIEKLKKGGGTLQEIYEEVVVADIQDACDILKRVYEETEGKDGFVSLEVSPHLARDTEKTKEEVKRLYHLVDRPNCLIKIPGTKEGIPAIEQMLYEGVNINITLLFSVEVYRDVAEAYLKALERRAEQGLAIDQIASVASFFLSRIDTLVDELLSHRMTEAGEDQTVLAKSLKGEIAIASACEAYSAFEELFQGERWKALEKKGARVQRPLWASTSTKDPDYSDVKYVETLIAPHTVNTMPDKTAKAFDDHGKVACSSIQEHQEKARQKIELLGELGIDIDQVTNRLVNEGIQKFIEPFDKLMEKFK